MTARRCRVFLYVSPLCFLYVCVHRMFSMSKVSTLTLFQHLATLAGYDPVRGLGSSCIGRKASGRCVLPWGSGTKSVSSVVLLANGIGFAVRHIIYALDLPGFVIMNTSFRSLQLSSQQSDL